MRKLATLIAILATLLLAAPAGAHKAPTTAQARAVLLNAYGRASVTHCRSRRHVTDCTLTLRWSGEGVEEYAEYAEAVGWHGNMLVAWERS
jgi:hypothetical protein